MSNSSKTEECPLCACPGGKLEDHVSEHDSLEDLQRIVDAKKRNVKDVLCDRCKAVMFDFQMATHICHASNPERGQFRMFDIESDSQGFPISVVDYSICERMRPNSKITAIDMAALASRDEEVKHLQWNKDGWQKKCEVLHQENLRLGEAYDGILKTVQNANTEIINTMNENKRLREALEAARPWLKTALDSTYFESHGNLKRALDKVTDALKETR